MTIKAIVWGENIHEHVDSAVADIYPHGMHQTIADALNADPEIQASTATLQQDEHGLPVDRLRAADVLLWWGHRAHADVSDEVVERIAEEVWAGLGLIVLHSAHFSKIFKRLMGTPCNLSWREAGERERLWITAPSHPIVRDLSTSFVLEHEEMYGEPFGIPEPMETVLISWFQGGEVFRSGVTYRRGAGHVFYFRPGHETYPTYHDPNVQTVLRNAVRWAHNPAKRLADVTKARNVTTDSAPEPIKERGPTLAHHPL